MFFFSKRKFVSLVGVCILLLTITVSCDQAQFDTKQITSVSITAIKISSLQNPPYPTVQKVVKNAKDAQNIFVAITSLSPVNSNQTYHCPANRPVYYSYKLDFMHNGNTIVSATSKVTACAFWSVTYTKEKSTSEYVASPDGFWVQLSTIAKVPMPQP